MFLSISLIMILNDSINKFTLLNTPIIISHVPFSMG